MSRIRLDNVILKFKMKMPTCLYGGAVRAALRRPAIDLDYNTGSIERPQGAL